jgi:hypothetical protein
VLDAAIQKKTSDFNLRLDCRVKPWVKPGNDSAGSVQTQHALERGDPDSNESGKSALGF